MDARVLLFSRDDETIAELPKFFQQSEIGDLKVIKTVEEIQYVWLKNLYNVLVIDALFGGTVEETAFLIRRLRQHFCDPIICFHTGEDFPDKFFSLRVAGCNFLFPVAIPTGAGGVGVPSKEAWQEFIQKAFVSLLEGISRELSEPHQRVTLC